MHVCDLCGFETESGHSMSNHKRWKHLGVGISLEVKQRYTKEAAERKLTEARVCPTCGQTFQVQGTPKGLLHKPKHCSRSCGNGREQTPEVRERKRQALQKTLPRPCAHCGSAFLPRSKANSFCSQTCVGLAKLARLDSSRIKDYRRLCQFRFALNQFPLEFDFELIEKYGWYKATNRGGNGSGVSRDHKVSIRWGFDHGVNPEIMSHPANCQLMIHEENLHTKGTKCSITLEELLSKIQEWDERYK